MFPVRDLELVAVTIAEHEQARGGIKFEALVLVRLIRSWIFTDWWTRKLIDSVDSDGPGASEPRRIRGQDCSWNGFQSRRHLL